MCKEWKIFISPLFEDFLYFNFSLLFEIKLGQHLISSNNFNKNHPLTIWIAGICVRTITLLARQFFTERLNLTF